MIADEMYNGVCAFFEFVPILLAVGCICLCVLSLFSLREKNESQDIDNL